MECWETVAEEAANVTVGEQLLVTGRLDEQTCVAAFFVPRAKQALRAAARTQLDGQEHPEQALKGGRARRKGGGCAE